MEPKTFYKTTLVEKVLAYSLFLTNRLKKIFKNCKNKIIKIYFSDEDIIAELELGDEERLLPTDLLNDDDEEDFESSSNSNSNSKIPLRKTWSWTPEQLPFDHSPETEVDQQENKQKSENNSENSVKSTNKKPELRQLEKAIKSLSIDPNMSISRKF